MASPGALPIRLADYRPPLVLIERVELLVQLFPSHTLVTAQLSITPNGIAPGETLQLQAVDLELLELSIDGLPVADQHWQLAAGRLELAAEVLAEGIQDPMNPGILKKRLGKLSCSKVRAARGKLKDKGTTYAKALQRYLNYHCQ